MGAFITGWDRYRLPSQGPISPRLRPTLEVFVDPETGKRQRVWFDPTPGLREYRDDV